MTLEKKLIPATLALMVMGSANNVVADDAETVNAMKEAWINYLETTSAVTQQLQESPSYAADPTGLIDIMTGMVRTNIDNGMSSSAASYRGRPRFNEFDTPNVRIGIDNPDTRYLAAHLPNADGQQVYRVWGSRSNSRDMILLTNDATDPQGGGATLEDEDMVNIKGLPLQLGEKFEVYLSTAEQYDPSYMLNWMEIGASDGLSLSSRYTMCQYEDEKPGKIAIERVGTKGVAITAQEFRNPEALLKGIQRATATMANQQPFWGAFGEIVRNSGLPANTIPPWQPTGAMGIVTQLSGTAYAELADDEALIISFRTDTPAVYGSVQMHNAWGSSLPWGHAMVNMSFGCDGNSNSEPTSDGLTHFVVTKNDPGVHNWLSTMGHESVFLSTRLQGVDPEHREEIMAQLPVNYGGYMPQSRVVKVEDLADILPADTAWVSSKERAKQIKVRQKYQRTKYGNAW